MPKYLIIFEKGESVRWLGHLDILRTFERAIRRAGLPIAFSNGFNPRERLAFASALSTGITGQAERATLELTQPLSEAELAPLLNSALPPGIRIVGCEPLTDLQAKEALNGFDAAEYVVVCACPEETRPEAVEAALDALLARPEIVVQREKEGRIKTINIRPNLHGLTLQAGSVAGERLTLQMIVGQGESGTARPTEVVEALSSLLSGLKARRAHRVRLVNTREQGPIV